MGMSHMSLQIQMTASRGPPRRIQIEHSNQGVHLEQFWAGTLPNPRRFSGRELLAMSCDELLALLDEHIECESFSPFYPHMKDRTTDNFCSQLDMYDILMIVCKSLTLHDPQICPVLELLQVSMIGVKVLTQDHHHCRTQSYSVVLSRTSLMTHELSHPTCLRSGNFGYSMPYQDQNASPRCALWRFAERR